MKMSKYNKHQENLLQNTFDESYQRTNKFSLVDLQELIKELADLNKKKIISDKQFNRIVTMACSSFIENEVENRISKIMNKSINHIFSK